MTYRGFMGFPEIDESEGVIYGRVINLTRDVITFSGKTYEEAKRDFEEAVDDYLEWAEQEGFEPEKPYRGEFMIRSTPELHRTIAMASASLQKSLSQFATEALRSYVEELVNQGVLAEDIYKQQVKAGESRRKKRNAHEV